MVTFKFIKNGIVETTIPETAFNAGSRTFIIQDLGSLTSGEYDVEVTAVSIYGTNTVVNSRIVYIDKEIVDTDSDGIGDLCDKCTDTDGDGYGNPGFKNTCPTDNCPLTYSLVYNGCSACCVTTLGNVNGDPDNSVDISDLTEFVNFLFFGPDPLTCYESSDLNCDCQYATISDLTYLIDYLFNGGNPPPPCDCYTFPCL